MGELTHTHDPPYGAAVPAGERQKLLLSAGQMYREGAGRWMVGDRRIIWKPGRDVVDGGRQKATGKGRWKPQSAGFVVADRKLRRSPAIRQGLESILSL